MQKKIHHVSTAFLTTLLPLKLNKWLENLALNLPVEAYPI